MHRLQIADVHGSIYITTFFLSWCHATLMARSILLQCISFAMMTAYRVFLVENVAIQGHLMTVAQRAQMKDYKSLRLPQMESY